MGDPSEVWFRGAKNRQYCVLLGWGVTEAELDKKKKKKKKKKDGGRDRGKKKGGGRSIGVRGEENERKRNGRHKKT